MISGVLPGVVPVAAPVRVRERLAAADDGPRRVLHASATAIYVDLDGWCLGIVSSGASRVPCALWSSEPDLTDLGREDVCVRAGVLHLGGSTVRVARLVDVTATAPDVAGRHRSARALAVTRSAGLTLPDDGHLSPAHLDRLLGRGPGLTPLGDDVLAGWLAARAAAGRPDTALAAAVRHRLVVTTLLSATLLDCALHGEVLPELGDWLASPTPATEEALLSVGATSGAGLLTGAALGLASLSTPTSTPTSTPNSTPDRPGRAA